MPKNLVRYGVSRLTHANYTRATFPQLPSVDAFTLVARLEAWQPVEAGGLAGRQDDVPQRALSAVCGRDGISAAQVVYGD
jgi:hypothetical protein